MKKFLYLIMSFFLSSALADAAPSLPPWVFLLGNYPYGYKEWKEKPTKCRVKRAKNGLGFQVMNSWGCDKKYFMRVMETFECSRKAVREELSRSDPVEVAIVWGKLTSDCYVGLSFDGKMKQSHMKELENCGPISL